MLLRWWNSSLKIMRRRHWTLVSHRAFMTFAVTGFKRRCSRQAFRANATSHDPPRTLRRGSSDQTEHDSTTSNAASQSHHYMFSGVLPVFSCVLPVFSCVLPVFSHLHGWGGRVGTGISSANSAQPASLYTHRARDVDPPLSQCKTGCNRTCRGTPSQPPPPPQPPTDSSRSHAHSCKCHQNSFSSGQFQAVFTRPDHKIRPIMKGMSMVW